MPTKKIGINDIEENLFYSNNNLLINSNFADPIYQRGLDLLVSNKVRYVFDRWKTALHANLAINNGYITLYSNSESNPGCGTTPEMQQGIYNVKSYIGKKMAGQLNYRITKGTNWHVFWFCTNSDGDIIYTKQIKLIHDGQWHTCETFMTVPEETDVLEFRVHHGSANIENDIYAGWVPGPTTEVSIDLKWAKVEAGEIATPYVARTKDEELLLCQPYYQRVNMSSANTHPYYITSDHIYFSINVNRLRSTPTVEFLSTIVFNAGNPISGFTYSFYGCNYNELTGNVFVLATKTGHGLTKNDILYLYNTIAFDCEL